MSEKRGLSPEELSVAEKEAKRPTEFAKSIERRLNAKKNLKKEIERIYEEEDELARVEDFAFIYGNEYYQLIIRDTVRFKGPDGATAIGEPDGYNLPSETWYAGEGVYEMDYDDLVSPLLSESGNNFATALGKGFNSEKGCFVVSKDGEVGRREGYKVTKDITVRPVFVGDKLYIKFPKLDPETNEMVGFGYDNEQGEEIDAKKAEEIEEYIRKRTEDESAEFQRVNKEGRMQYLLDERRTLIGNLDKAWRDVRLIQRMLKDNELKMKLGKKKWQVARNNRLELLLDKAARGIVDAEKELYENSLKIEKRI